MIYPADIAIHRLNNWGQVRNKSTRDWATHCFYPLRSNDISISLCLLPSDLMAQSVNSRNGDQMWRSLVRFPSWSAEFFSVVCVDLFPSQELAVKYIALEWRWHFKLPSDRHFFCNMLRFTKSAEFFYASPTWKGLNEHLSQYLQKAGKTILGIISESKLNQCIYNRYNES